MVVQVGRQSHSQVVGLLVDAVSDILTVTDDVVVLSGWARVPDTPCYTC